MYTQIFFSNFSHFQMCFLNKENICAFPLCLLLLLLVSSLLLASVQNLQFYKRRQFYEMLSHRLLNAYSLGSKDHCFFLSIQSIHFFLSNPSRAAHRISSRSFKMGWPIKDWLFYDFVCYFSKSGYRKMAENELYRTVGCPDLISDRRYLLEIRFARICRKVPALCTIQPAVLWAR
jgi:hypothetical protein